MAQSLRDRFACGHPLARGATPGKIEINTWRFLQIDVLVMPPALFAALAAAIR
jgi:hypothetical protein